MFAVSASLPAVAKLSILLPVQCSCLCCSVLPLSFEGSSECVGFLPPGCHLPFHCCVLLLCLFCLARPPRLSLGFTLFSSFFLLALSPERAHHSIVFGHHIYAARRNSPSHGD